MVSASSSTSPWVRPLAGSSSISRRGLAARARANSMRLSVPNGRPTAWRPARSARPRRSRICMHWSRRRRSSLPTPMRSRPRPKPTEPLVWAPTITFSRTVSAGNSARFWNVRAMPMRAILYGGSASRSCPSKVMWPSVGWYRRLTQLNSVVLPAPLGPISAQICPSSMTKLSPSSATTPPKRTPTSSISSRATPHPLDRCHSLPNVGRTLATAYGTGEVTARSLQHRLDRIRVAGQRRGGPDEPSDRMA